MSGITAEHYGMQDSYAMCLTYAIILTSMTPRLWSNLFTFIVDLKV